MGITHLSGLEVAGVPTMGVNGLPVPFTGNYFFVNESTGADGNSGAADQPFATLAQAQTAATSGNNDVVFFTGTIHQTSTLTWAKNNVHLVGLCAPIKRGKRARISVSGTTAFTPLVSVTGNGCYFYNFGTFYGFNSASNNAICWYDTGGRNCYDNVEFLGFGDGTASTGTANITGARAFSFNTSTGETTWRNCVFGVDTQTRNATNYTVEIAGGAPRLTFESCDFEALLGSSGTASSHFLIGASGIDRYMNMVNCRLLNSVKSTGSAMAQAFNLNAAIGGLIIFQNSWALATAIETATTSQIFLTNAAVSQSGSKPLNNS